MKPLGEQSHYEVLEIPRGASAEEIERAYRLARLTYATESFAAYSVFDEREAAALRERIDTAYRVLVDPESRSRYDAALPDAESACAAEPEGALAPAPDPRAADAGETLFDAEDESAQDFDGSRLRRARLRRGIEIQDIASVTKINPTYLGFIEENRFAELPAAVYVRGFVKAYASCVGLDPQRVAPSYMRRYEESRSSRRRRGFRR